MQKTSPLGARRRSLIALTGLTLLVPALAAAQETPPAPLQPFPATDAQPIGMDEAEIKSFHTKDLDLNLDRERYEFLWREGFLFMTPRHTARVAPFEIARFEVTNAQWKVFLDDPVNADSDVTQPGMTLRDIVTALYDIDPAVNPADAQSAGLYIYYRNEGRLMSALNPDADPAWEPLRGAWVEDAVIPAGTKIEYTRILPPPYWKGGEVPEDERDRPVRYLSWNDARLFCRWAGLHLPLEAEWERAARGDEGRRFPWGDDWNPAAAVWKRFRGQDAINAGPLEVDSMGEFATPEGVYHLLGNVSEYVFDFAHRYTGSKSPFKYDNAGCLARGGMWDDENYVMLGADRIWDIGTTQISPELRADGFGFRYAAYPQSGRDLTLELATYAGETFRVSGAATWLPYPVGLPVSDREKRHRRQPLQGFALDGTAGWLLRDLDPAAADHANVRGAARGIAFIPIKGLMATYLKDKGRFTKLSLDKAEVAFVGALVATPNCKITLRRAGQAPAEESDADTGGDGGEEGTGEGEAENTVVLDMGDEWSALWTTHDLGFRYQVGAWLVLEGNKIAVYAGDGSEAGVFGAHLRGEPLGYLPEPYTATWSITAETPPSGGYAGGVATLSAPIPQIEKDGTPRKRGKAVLLTIKVPATFE